MSSEQKPSQNLSTGYSYSVSERQLEIFSQLSVWERAQWLSEAQRVSWELATPETKRRWEILRGKRFSRLE